MVGGLEHWVASRSRSALVASRKFGPHAVYIIGDPIIHEVNGEQTITIALSSENLLLNAWRQAQMGLPQIVQVRTGVPLQPSHAHIMF